MTAALLAVVAGTMLQAAPASATAVQHDAAIRVRIERTRLAIRNGKAVELLVAQLVDQRGLPTNNGGVVARIAWEATGAGAVLGAPTAAASTPHCEGPGVAGSGLTAPATGLSECQLSAPVGEAVTVDAVSAATAFESPQPVVGLGGTAISEVASAAYDSYFVTRAGGVLAVGENPLGELGNGTTTSSPSPVAVRIPAGDHVSAIVGGGYFALALTTSGSVLAWGQDFIGQLGNGRLSPSVLTPQPVMLPPSTRITQVAAGCNHALALTASGTVLAWGENLSGQLGDGGRALSDTPVAVRLPAGTVAKQVAAGCNTSYALTTKGAVYAWGSGSEGQLGTGSTLASSSVPVPVAMAPGVSVSSISAGNSDGYLLTVTGTVMAWGGNRLGEAGTPGATHVLRPQPVTFPRGQAIVSVVGGGFNAFAMTSAHQLYAWGGNTNGQDGIGSLRDLMRPAPVVVPGGLAIATVNGASAGGFQAVAETTSGAVLAWGANFDGQLGYGVDTTSYFAVGLARSGSAYAWGSDSTGGFGNGPATTQSLVPLAALAGKTWRSLSAGCTQVLGLSRSGQVYAWGGNFDGQAGGASQSPSTLPAAVPLPGNQPAVAVAAGCIDSLALASDGRVYAWGANESGELGDGATTVAASPVAVSLPAGASVKAIAAGCSFGMALTTTGTVYTWGDNSQGQLGHGGGPAVAVPQPVPGLPPLDAIAAGCYHALGMAADGTVYAWGDNASGQLGTGTTTSSLTPVQVKLPSSVRAVAIAAGGEQSFLLTSAGVAYGWGNNTTGQLGTGGFFDVLTPTAVHLPAGSSVSSIATHGVSTLVLTDPAAPTYAVGGNLFGQLGDASTLTTSVPQPVRGIAAGLASGSLGGYADWTYLYPTPLAGQSVTITS